ncbi:MAG: hypothetical protein IJ561_08155 [Ruminococcus sp.]|nr:hypothetical protein [Ruminococcus sp.]
MKKILSMLCGAAAALSMGVICAAAEDITLEAKGAEETADGISYVITSDDLIAAQITSDTEFTVSYTADADPGVCPIKLLVSYWSDDGEHGGVGSPVTAELIPETYEDGKATIAYSELMKAIGQGEFDPIFEMAVAANGASVKCTGVSATNAKSREDLVAKDILSPFSVDVSEAKEVTNWGQSISARTEFFDASRMTTKSRVLVYFTADDEYENCPVELIMQSWEFPDTPEASEDGKVWAKAQAADYGDGWALFNYTDLIETYGTADFNQVSAINVGDTNQCSIICTGLYITNCKAIGTHKSNEETDESSEDASSEEPAVTTTTTTAAPETTTTAAAPESVAEEKSSTGTNIVLIIIGVVAGVGIAVAALFIILGRKSKETYDVKTGKFIKK